MPPKPGKNPREQFRKGPTTHRVILGDSREMPELADESVHLVVTSPPYANLKAYAPGNPSQLGDIVEYGEFLDELDQVWAECFRALVPGGRICCVVGGERRPPLCTASGFRHSRPGTAPRLRSSAGHHLVQGHEHQAGGLTIHTLPGKAEPPAAS